MSDSAKRTGAAAGGLKLNIGCGYNKQPGFLSVDKFAACGPDLVCDVEKLPWSWADDSVEEVLFNHSLEHIGEDAETFLGVMKELYRVCRNGAEIQINVPHPRNDDFLNDPTHVRVITPAGLSLFDKELNDRWKATGVPNTPLAHYLGVDFKIVHAEQFLDEPYESLLRQGRMKESDFPALIRERNNVVREVRIRLRVVKGVVAAP